MGEVSPEEKVKSFARLIANSFGISSSFRARKITELLL